MPLRVEAVYGTPNWVAARRGCASASRMNDVLATSKRDGKPLKARTDYLMELVSELMTGLATDHYVTPAMQWGIDHEAQASDQYEIETGIVVASAGWILHPSIDFFGATPDRAVQSDGLIEIKCPTTTTFLTWVRNGCVPEEHRAQMLAQLACTRRKWCDFVAFDPRVAGCRNPIFIRRFVPTPEQISEIEQAAVNFLKDVEEVFCAVVQDA